MAWPYTYKWQQYRKRFLEDHPFCKCGKLSTVVDHIIPHKLDMKLFWAPGNHQAKCKQCHDMKTASTDGGFGNKMKDAGEGGQVNRACDVTGKPTDPDHHWNK